MRSKDLSASRARWAAIGAAVAVTVGAGGIVVTNATVGSGERAVYVPITPCRLFDTRAGDQVGPRGTPIAAGETMSQSVRGTNGNCTVPADATAVAMNVTIDNPTGFGFLTIWPSDATRPLASSLNWTPGAPPVPNKVDSKLSADGRISLYNSAGTVDVLADVVGYYVDHTHDDRYYTRAELDAALAQRDAAITQLDQELDAKVAELDTKVAQLDGELDTKVTKATGTRSLFINASEFRPTGSGDAFVHAFAGSISGGANGYCIAAPVVLPDGATIIAFGAEAFDNSAGFNASIGLYRDPPGPAASVELASASSAGQPGFTTITAAAVSEPVVDNANNSYVVFVCSILNTISLYDAVITYALSA